MLLWDRAEWKEDSACLGSSPELFFPDILDDAGEEVFDDGTVYKSYGPTSHLYDAGRSVCASCPVSDSCLAYATENRIRFGLWGGLDPLERRRIERRERRSRLQERRRYEALGIPYEWDDDPDDDY